MKNSLTIITIILSFPIFSQTGKIFTELNYNTFSHKNLSSFHQELISDIATEIPIVTTDDFPSNIGFSLGYEVTDQDFAIFIGYNATGAKSSYADYSGVVSIQQQLNAITFGGMYLINLNDKKDFKIGLKGFGMYSSLDINSLFEIANFTSEEDSLEFSSIDIGIGASLIYEYPITSFLILRASLGFDLVLSTQLNFKDIDNAHLLDESDNKVKTGWSGLRSGIGIAIPIN